MAFAMLLRHTVHALLAMIASLLCLAISFYIISAPLAAAVEVIVYAGAIMVLFAFAVMLLQIPIEKSPKTKKNKLLVSMTIFFVFWGEIIFVLRSGFPPSKASPLSINSIALAVFSDYGFLLELCSMLLLAGLAAAIYVGAHLMNTFKVSLEEVS
jgi:NADH-quinone oxidoreductase subunit J